MLYLSFSFSTFSSRFFFSQFICIFLSLICIYGTKKYLYRILPQTNYNFHSDNSFCCYLENAHVRKSLWGLGYLLLLLHFMKSFFTFSDSNNFINFRNEIYVHRWCRYIFLELNTINTS